MEMEMEMEMEASHPACCQSNKASTQRLIPCHYFLQLPRYFFPEPEVKQHTRYLVISSINHHKQARGKEAFDS